MGIDIGTGSTKAVALDRTGSVIAVAQQYYTTSHPLPGWSEQDPESIWMAFCAALQDIIGQCGNPPDAVVLSAAMHSVLVLDESGKPLAPAMLWSDTRSAAIAEQLKNTPEGILIYQATGTPVHAMSPLCKIAWLRKHGPLQFQAATRFLSIKEFIWHKLFGVFEIDDSMASGPVMGSVVQIRTAPLVPTVTAPEPLPVAKLPRLARQPSLEPMIKGMPFKNCRSLWPANESVVRLWWVRTGVDSRSSPIPQNERAGACHRSCSISTWLEQE